MKKVCILLLVFLPVLLFSQGSKWQRSAPTEVPLQLFNSTKAFALPTAETQSAGDFYFNITHRFVLPVSEGIGEVWGVDGSVIMRIALGYTITDDLMAVIGRSNREGNIDLQLKYKVYTNDNDVAPFSIALMGAGAYNGKPPENIDDEFQFYGFAIFNTMLFDKLGIGLTPGFLYNSYINCDCNENSVTMGAYAQYYFDDMWSVGVEANPTLTGWRRYYDSYTLGVEIETGGHFFKISLGNNIMSNLSQYMAGAADAFDSGDLHLGFQIQRTL